MLNDGAGFALVVERVLSLKRTKKSLYDNIKKKYATALSFQLLQRLHTEYIKKRIINCNRYIQWALYIRHDDVFIKNK